MNELLQELLKNQLLSEETQKQLQEAFTKTVNDAIEVAKQDTVASTKIELTEKWLADRDQLIEALDKKVDDVLKAELVELKESIESFRDLEVEYAGKLAEHKAAMAEEVKSDMVELLESLDAFLEMRITTEMEEIKESIEAAKKLDFGRRIFEAFAEEFDLVHTNDDAVKAELVSVKAKLAETTEALEEVIADRDALERQDKLEELLSNLDSYQREVMETVLNTVATEKLDEAYKTFLPRIMKESVNTVSEKETEKVLAEGVKEVAAAKTVVVTGDRTSLSERVEDKAVVTNSLSESARIMLKKLGGIK